MQEPVFPRIYRGQRISLCHLLGRSSADGSERATVEKHEQLSVFARHTAGGFYNGHDCICFCRALRIELRLQKLLHAPTSPLLFFIIPAAKKNCKRSDAFKLHT